MKNLLLIFVLTPLFCISQNDFRKMNWGDSVNDLKEKYKEITFTIDKKNERSAYFHSDFIGGIDAQVFYLFNNNELFSAGYMFSTDSYKDSKERLRDFYSISKRLNDKYDIEREDQWLVKTWKDNPDQLYHALRMGDVQLIESGQHNETLIRHVLGQTDGSLSHNLIYTSTKVLDYIQDEIDEDF